MEELNILDLNPYLKNSKYIGKGNCARCYLLSDGSILKVFKHNYDAKCVLRQPLFNEELNKFGSIGNDTYICPKTIVKQNNEIVGYIYPHVNGKNLSKINNNIKLYDLFYSYEQIIIDTKKISDQYFCLFDIHRKNIIYDGSIHIIDLDKGYFKDTTYDLHTTFLGNINSIFDTIFGKIYNTDMDEIIEFSDLFVQNKFRKTNKGDINSVNEFLKFLAAYTEIQDPTLNDIKRKVKAKNVHNDYFKHYTIK